MVTLGRRFPAKTGGSLFAKAEANISPSLIEAILLAVGSSPLRWGRAGREHHGGWDVGVGLEAVVAVEVLVIPHVFLLT